MADHFIVKCSCGVVLMQCRCPNPAKRVEVRQRACEACKAVEQGHPPKKESIC